jgi:DNA-binding MarR family transcriptional regulator
MYAWYTHRMTDTPRPASAHPAGPPTDPPPASSRSDASILDALDDVLVDVRQVLQRPGYRRRLLATADTSLELGTLRALRAVERFGPGAPGVGDAAEVLVVAPSPASRTLDRCVAAGLLERTPCARDRRRAELALTDDGRTVLDGVTAARRELLAEVTAHWSDDDLARLTELLVSLRTGFDRLEDGP